MKDGWKLLVAVCVLVIGVYAYMAESGVLELLSPNAADTYYNLLVRGFRAGQLSVKKEAPPGLAQLADPYDPSASGPYWGRPYQMLDLSYYKGKLYLYWGVTPALILFWPYVAVTGRYLFHWQAVAIFCTAGFLASVGLLRALWRRYFPEVSVGVVAACVLALGLATGVPMLLSNADVYEVSISCGYMLTMLALGAIWRALHEPERSCRWLAAASLAYGLAVGSRPSLLFGAVILLVPVVHAWRERRKIGAQLMAAVGPLLLIGLGLMLYNVRRFDNPFEFGMRYQLCERRLVLQQLFGLRYLWFNFRVYFLEPARWSARSPFVHGTTALPRPAGYAPGGNPFGVLTNIPLVWLAAAVPLAWRGRSEPAGSSLRWFVTTAALQFGICAMTLGLFCASNFRYEVDFLPALLLLAAIGILGLERALAERPAAWRWAARWSWGVLLVVSVAFNLLASLKHYAEAHNARGNVLFEAGNTSEAIGQYQRALQIDPDYPDAHESMGNALMEVSRLAEAIGEYERALRIRPDNPETHNNLGTALLRTRRVTESIGQFEEALRIKPDLAVAHDSLGVVLLRVGRVAESLGHFEKAARLMPDDADIRYNLGTALMRLGRVPEAIGQFEQALRIRPDYVEAQQQLERLRGGVGK